MTIFAQTVALAAIAASVAHGAPTWAGVGMYNDVTTSSDAAMASRSNWFPFDRVVAFGDNLSDNGNGSCAHGVAQPGEPHNNIYGYYTWTNGPVAVSYLARDLGAELIDYAFGHANGGSRFGATVDNAYTQSTANAPSTKDQIDGYVHCDQAVHAGSTLHFLWTGNNDINLYHLGTAVGSDNTKFAAEMADHIGAQVQTLINAGAQHVFVPSLYAKHLSPSKHFYASNDDEFCVLGEAIAGANAAIEAKLAAFGDRVTFYDVFGKMVQLWENHASIGISHVGDTFCDGHTQLDWDLCVVQHQGESYYWMQYLDMTSHVHYLLAKDMLAVLKTRFGVV